MLRLANAGDASVGPVSFNFDGKAALIAQNRIIGSPLYAAGLERGDHVIALDRLKIQSQDQWDNAVGRYNPGDTATIHYIQRGMERTAELTFAEDDELEVVTYEAADTEISKAQLEFRTSWIGSDSQNDD